ncbi:MAG: FtsQ-type POTRA domain-containing protein [Bacteroidota bacterium]
MKTKPFHISRRLKRLLGGLALGAMLAGAGGLTLSRAARRTCNAVHVEITNAGENSFVQQSDISDMLGRGQAKSISGALPSEIDTRVLEKRILTNPYVQEVQVSRSLLNELSVKLQQVRPVARLICGAGRDVYICDNGARVPVSPSWTARVPVIDGEHARKLARPDSASANESEAALQLMKFISENELWREMIAQATVDNAGEYILYPQIGKQKIYFGRAEDIENKFSRLEAFYRKIVPAKGWDTYSKVTLKFSNQIICE